MSDSDFNMAAGVSGGVGKYIRLGGNAINDISGAMDIVFEESDGNGDGEYCFGVWNMVTPTEDYVNLFGLYTGGTFGMNCRLRLRNTVVESIFGTSADPSPPSWQELNAVANEAPVPAFYSSRIVSRSDTGSVNKLFKNGQVIATRSRTGATGSELDTPAILLGVGNSTTPASPYTYAEATCGCFVVPSYSITDAEMLELYQHLRDYLMIPTGRIPPPGD